MCAEHHGKQTVSRVGRAGPPAMLVLVCGFIVLAGVLVTVSRCTKPVSGVAAAPIKLAQAMVGRTGPIAKALDKYKYDMGKYPETDEGLAVLFEYRGGREQENWKGPYLDGRYGTWLDPWDSSFEYRAPGVIHEDGYDLWSRGPDREDNGGRAGSDDIKNWVDK